MERKSIQTLIPILALGLAALAFSCGGSGSTQTPAAMQPSAPVALSGAVSGTSGALTFAGQPLSVGGALVTDQGAPATLAAIKPGSVIQGTALKASLGFQLQVADLRYAVEGLVASVDLTGSKLVVMGQTVVVDALTVIEQEVIGGPATSLTLADLKIGDLVEVDGALNADGSIQASRIEREPASSSPDLFLRGVVSALDTTAQTFQTRGFTVSYGTAVVTGTLANGVEVVVHGTWSGTTLTATRVVVRAADDPPGTLEVSGPVSGLDATAKTFMLMSYTVDYSQATVKGTLADGALVEVEGMLNTSGTATVLTASKVEVAFAHPGSGDCDGEKTGTVTATDATALTLTVGSDTFWTDSATLFVKDGAAATFADVTVGAKVSLHFLSTRTNAAGQAYANKVEILPF